MKRTICSAGIAALAVAAWVPAPTAAAPRCYPTSRFVVLSGGLVRDTLTQLVWQRQASKKVMDWEAAKAYCASSGFRLPTVKELASLIDTTVTSGPTIDQTAFPATPTFHFWTSSRFAGNDSVSRYAWYVDFNYGYWNFDVIGPYYQVRCVRPA